jgi:hypothetical protein
MVSPAEILKFCRVPFRLIVHINKGLPNFLSKDGSLGIRNQSP